LIETNCYRDMSEEQVIIMTFIYVLNMKWYLMNGMSYDMMLGIGAIGVIM
jgi:hypothetical protein